MQQCGLDSLSSDCALENLEIRFYECCPGITLFGVYNFKNAVNTIAP
jgi:hypothetical protein